MATINEMRQVATQIENETQVGGNTAGRVGGLFNDIVDKLEDDEANINIVQRVEITYKQCQIPNKYINDTNVGSALSLQSNNDYGVFYFFVRKGQSFAISSTYVAPSASRLYIFHLDEDLDIVQRYENVVVGTTTYTATEDCIVVGTLYGNDSIQYTGIQKAYLVNGKMNEVGLTGANIIQHLKDLEAGIDNDINNLNTEVGSLENEVFGTPSVSNLPLSNNGVLNANGTISLYEDWYNSDYFAVDSAKQYTYNGSIYGGGNILYYDSAKNLLGACSNIPVNYADRTNPVELNDMPSNAAYIRVSGYDISACSITESDSLRPKVEKIEERIDNLIKPQGIIEPVFSATLGNPVRIKLLGDSITQGWGGSNFDQDGAEIYPLGEGWQTHRNLHGYCWANMMRDYLETKYHCTVVNNAITGTSTRNIVTRLDDFIDAADDIVICAYGTNNRNNYDGNNTEWNSFVPDLFTIVNYCKERNKTIILVANIPASSANEQSTDNGHAKSAHMNDVHDAVLYVAESTGVECVDMYDAFNDYCINTNTSLGVLLGDGLHPNDNGYDVYYSLIMPRIGVAIESAAESGGVIDGNSTTIKVRRNTAAVFTSANPVLADGELGFETDRKRYKMGDGVTAWNSLEYRSEELDTTPTIGSEKGVTSGGVADAIDDITNVNLNGLLIRRGFLKPDNTWNTSAGYHVMIYVGGYEQVVVNANSSIGVEIALLTSAAKSGTASYATGASRITVLANEKIALDIPSNAKYLYVVYGADTTYNQKPDYVKLYSNGFSRLDKKMDNYTETVYNASSFTTVGVLKTSDGSVQNDSTTQNYRTSDYIPVESDMVLIYKDVFPSTGGLNGICIYNHLGLFIAAFDLQTSETVNNGVVNLSDYTDVAYIRISTNSEITTATTECKLQKHYTISDVATTIDSLNGKVIRNNYGCGISGNYTEPSNVLYETSNTPCLKAGIVERITGYFKYSGTATIATGFIDQNGYMIIGKEYNVTIPSTGNNNIDVESKGIYLNEGEYLLAKVTGTCYPNFGVDASAVTGLYVNMEYEAHVRSDNIYFCFGWVVKSEVPNYETLSDNVAAQEREIESLQETIANIDTSGVITDSETGTPYKITIRNGQIVLVPTLYSNVLVLGNSITVHPLSSIWPASDRGMAATKPEYDFCGIMQTQMRLKDNTTVVTRLNIADWERDFTTDLSTLIGNNLTSNTDLVVIRLGENVTNNSGFGTALNNVLSYIYGVNPNAKVVVTSMFWASSAKDEILKSFADSHGLTYVKINQFGNSAYEEAIGHYTYNTDFTAISEITNSGVAQHPSNKGMCAIANEILNALGYEKSTNAYTLQSVTVGGTTGIMYVLNT